MITSLRNAASIQVSLSIRAEVSQLDESNREHALILDAYDKRDAELAIDLTGRHLRSTLDIVEAYERTTGPAPSTEQ
jgi:DNA-binding GntR family transcriptional regulator